ncbi:hypothetical protein ACH5RR_024292 [Cinchona calisaya]|uniref:GDSL esterase/lipase 1-like n=1 Tax=Cinchona calisaya TaxID=153742 RepID=A0ABD2YZP2_9GENT
MAISCIKLCLVLLFFLASFTIPLDCFPDIHPKTTVALVVFGDSLFDPGNNDSIKTTTEFQANFPPYGESFFKYPTGRFCDGRVIPDFIAEYAKLNLIPPYLETHNHQLANGINFASGGAGALAETNTGLVIDLKMQLRNFKKVEKQLRMNLGKRGAQRVVSNAVYLFSIGSNDYLSPLTNNSSIFKLYSPQDYVAMVVGNITATFKEIYKKGGRKFGTLNLGPFRLFAET